MLFPLVCKVSAENSYVHVTITPLYVTSCFSLLVFKIFFLSLGFLGASAVKNLSTVQEMWAMQEMWV